MTKFMIFIFGGLTLGAAYLTLTDYGVIAPQNQKPNVRNDSVHSGLRGVGRYRSGK